MTSIGNGLVPLENGQGLHRNDKGDEFDDEYKEEANPLPFGTQLPNADSVENISDDDGRRENPRRSNRKAERVHARRQSQKTVNLDVEDKEAKIVPPLL